MSNVRCVGLDVHERSITIAIAEPGDAPPVVLRRIENDVNELLKTLRGLRHSGNTVKVAYEAGSLGFALFRRIQKDGFACHVIAPSRVPKDGRKKTDAEDALRIARFLRSGDLTSVYVPSPELEAVRTLVRAREDAIESQQRARQQLRHFLLREERRSPHKTSWTLAHLTWIRAEKFDHPAKTTVRDDYVREVEAAAARVARLTKDVEAMIPQTSLMPMVTALQALKGVQLITAATIAAEIGNFSRFAKAKHLMSYLGLVPGEHSSGERIAHGSITKAGNAHVRRVLCEAAWNCRTDGAGKTIRARRALTDETVQQIAEKAQERLHHRYRHLAMRRKEANKINVAMSRELAGFIWAIARHVEGTNN
jgi:transposase